MAIKVGVIGAGYLGTHHARIYSGLDGVELAFVADADPAVASAVAASTAAAPATTTPRCSARSTR